MSEIYAVANEIADAYHKARAKHAPMHSAHEGSAIIREEFEELWDEVKAWQPIPVLNEALPSHFQSIDFADAVERHNANLAAMRKEALHVAAMALAFIIEICDAQ